MDQLQTTNNHEAVEDYGPSFNSLVNLSESIFFDKFSNPEDDGIGCDSNNGKIESTEESSDKLVDAENHFSVCENDISSISCAKNEAIENGDDPSVVEENHNAVKDFEKVDNTADFSLEPNEVTDNVSKKEDICSHNGDTSLANDEILESDHRNNFIPTIVEIRGGCPDVLKLADQSSSTSLHRDVSSCTSPEDNTCIRDLTMKEELPNNVVDNDCVHTETVHCKTSSSNELLSKEEKSDNTRVGDPVLICKKGASKLRSLIPIKVESHVQATSQPSSSQTEKYVAEKRFTRSSLSKSNDSISLSSSCKDSASHSKKRKLPKNAPYSSGTYSCHLCNTVFQDHESLNEHMIRHRKNNVKNRSKTAKLKPYSCNVCEKELSTSQSLQQHVLIHKNVKPFGCHVCHKDFRHLSNFRMHLLKHKAGHGDTTKQTDKAEQFDESVAHTGQLNGLKNLKHREPTISKTSRSLRSATSSSTVTKKTTFKPPNPTKKASRQPELSFDQTPLKIKNNTSSMGLLVKRQFSKPDSVKEGDMAVKNFKNIESVVMNASKIIVKLDDLDTRMLKRKLVTPNISIDKLQKKCRIQLSPIAEKYNLKLDEIENIPMDVDSDEIDLSLEQDDRLDDLNEKNGVETTHPVYPVTDTLSDNELFTLLNDDGDTSTATTISVHSTDGSSMCSEILQPEHQNLDAKTTISADIDHSLVIVEETSSYEIYSDDETAVDDLVDAFDTAFQKVATRRLALLRKRAAANGGKIQIRYVLGPLFWCKAVRRAKKCLRAVAVGSDDNIDSGSNDGSPDAKTRSGLRKFGSRSRFDDRRTNDPLELQSRAEKKFKCLLKRAKMAANANGLNLAGPLFWRRTLQLAGVHRGEDLQTHMNVGLLTLEGVEFVDDDETCDFDAKIVDTEELMSEPDPVLIDGTALSKSNNQLSTDQLPNDEISPSITSGIADDVSKLPDQILAPAMLVEQHIRDNTGASNVSNEISSLEIDSVSFESLIEPEENQHQPVIEPDNSASNIDNSVALSFSNNCKTELPENCSNLELTDDSTVVIEDNRFVSRDMNDSDALNGGKNSQLIFANNDGEACPEAGQNFVLVSDGSGTMQYLVVTNENYPNFELIGDNGCGEQVAYAFQFDGENYTAVQFVQDGCGFQPLSDDGLKEADSKPATYLISTDAAATAVVSDPNHIGKELSDFLNLDYGSLLQNGATDQPSS